MDLCNPRFPRVLIYMICELLTPWSFCHSSVPTLEDLDLVYIDLCSLRFSRVLIYIISVLLTSWSFCHSSLPTFEDLDLVYMDLCSHRFPRVLVLCDMLYLTNNWKYKKNSWCCIMVSPPSYVPPTYSVGISEISAFRIGRFILWTQIQSLLRR